MRIPGAPGRSPEPPGAPSFWTTQTRQRGRSDVRLQADAALNSRRRIAIRTMWSSAGLHPAYIDSSPRIVVWEECHMISLADRGRAPWYAGERASQTCIRLQPGGTARHRRARGHRVRRFGPRVRQRPEGVVRRQVSKRRDQRRPGQDREDPPARVRPDRGRRLAPALEQLRWRAVRQHLRSRRRFTKAYAIVYSVEMVEYGSRELQAGERDRLLDGSAWRRPAGHDVHHRDEPDGAPRPAKSPKLPMRKRGSIGD